MPSMRAFELARVLGVDTVDLVERGEQLGIQVDNPSTSLDEHAIDLLRRSYQAELQARMAPPSANDRDPGLDVDAIDLAPGRGTGRGSPAPWTLPLISLGIAAVVLIVATTLKPASRAPDQLGEIDISVVIELGTFALVAGLVALSPMKTVSSRPLALLWVYVLLMGFTAVYAVSPELSLVGAAQLGVMALLAHAMAVRGPGRHHTAFFVGVVAFSAVLLASALLLPNNPNSTARLSTSLPALNAVDFATYLGLAVIVVAYAIRRHPLVFTIGRRWLAYALMAAFAFGMVASQSRVAIVATAAALILMWLVNGGSLTDPRVQLGVIAAGLVTVVFSSVLVAFFARGDPESLSGLNGRSNLWQEVWPLVEDSPLVGHGFLSGRDLIPELELEGGFSTDVAHNFALETLLNGGVIALAVFSALVVAVVYSLSRALRRLERGQPMYMDASLYLAVIVYLVIIGTTESQLAQNANHATGWLAMSVAWLGGFARLMPERESPKWARRRLLSARRQP
ncbi:MAG: hypothetical protein HKN80_06520 [Acidimicrobiia bacterium]|nr:hypothetical protein [Acidimicrobiia bacterium]